MIRISLVTALLLTTLSLGVAHAAGQTKTIYRTAPAAARGEGSRRLDANPTVRSIFGTFGASDVLLQRLRSTSARQPRYKVSTGDFPGGAGGAETIVTVHKLSANKFKAYKGRKVTLTNN